MACSFHSPFLCILSLFLCFCLWVREERLICRGENCGLVHNIFIVLVYYLQWIYTAKLSFENLCEDMSLKVSCGELFCVWKSICLWNWKWFTKEMEISSSEFGFSFKKKSLNSLVKDLCWRWVWFQRKFIVTMPIFRKKKKSWLSSATWSELHMICCSMIERWCYFFWEESIHFFFFFVWAEHTSTTLEYQQRNVVLSFY